MAVITKADIRREQSHQRQMERIAARAEAAKKARSQQSRARTREIKVRSEARIRERTEAVRIKEETRAARQPEFDRPRPLQVSSSIAAHRREVAAQEKAQANAQVATGGSRTGGVVRGLAHATPTVVQSANPGRNNLWLWLFVVFGLIIFYLLSTHNTSGFFGTLTSGLNALSSTSPLFSASTNSPTASNSTTATAEPSPSPGATNQMNSFDQAAAAVPNQATR